MEALPLSSLRKKAKTLSPIVRIGKNGLTDSMIVEIEKLLDSRELVKIKLLKSCLGDSPKESIISEAVQKTNATLIDSIGLVFTIYRKRKEEKGGKSP